MIPCQPPGWDLLWLPFPIPSRELTDLGRETHEAVLQQAIRCHGSAIGKSPSSGPPSQGTDTDVGQVLQHDVLHLEEPRKKVKKRKKNIGNPGWLVKMTGSENNGFKKESLYNWVVVHPYIPQTTRCFSFLTWTSNFEVDLLIIWYSCGAA